MVLRRKNQSSRKREWEKLSNWNCLGNETKIQDIISQWCVRGRKCRFDPVEVVRDTPLNFFMKQVRPWAWNSFLVVPNIQKRSLIVLPTCTISSIIFVLVLSFVCACRCVYRFRKGFDPSKTDWWIIIILGHSFLLPLWWWLWFFIYCQNFKFRGLAPCRKKRPVSWSR